jgi:colanic acid biosynthesis glycosyl transferase WcaI
MQYELGKHMAAAGHQVTVVTTHSLHRATVDEKTVPSEQTLEGMHITRVKTVRWDSKRFLQRFLIGMIMDLRIVLKGLRCGPADVVFFMSPPITLPIMASLFRIFRRKSLLVLNVQDIFPEFLVAMGILGRGSPVIRFGRLLEKWAYSVVDYIGVHSPKNRLHVIECGVPKEKVHVLPLWVDTGLLKPQPRCNPFSEKYGLNDKFVVLYAGTIGFAMGAQTIPRTAGLLAGEKDIQLVVIGAGSQLDIMNEEIKKAGAGNLLLLPPQPREAFADVLASADVLLVTLRKETTDNPNGYFQAVVPHKLLSNMATGRPILLAAEGSSDTAALIRLAQCGKVVAPEDPEALAEAIKELNQQRQMLPQWGENARVFACRHFDSKAQVERLEHLFSSLVKGDKSYRLNDPWETNSTPD